MYNIIVVENEQEIADLVALYLRNENYTVHKFYSGRDAIKFIDESKAFAEIDLAILDIMLPDVNGFAVCRHIREKHTYPIIMLTAKDEEVDKITGLSFGADDYITKPFRPLELVARVKAQLRRYKTYNRNEYRHADAAEQDGIFSHLGLILNSKSNNTITVHIRHLREKMGDTVEHPKYIKTIWGVGYKIEHR